MKTVIAASIAILLGTAAFAAEPVGSDKFNTDPGFDLATLTAGNFYDVIVPLAKKEGTLTFYDFTDSFGPLFNEHLLPAFEKKYGLKVEYVRGEGDVAIQQLIAAHNTKSKAPADAYFISSGKYAAVLDAGVVANVALNEILPFGKGLNAEIATSTGGFAHGGVFLPFHRNQTSIIYDTRTVSADKAPADLDALLAWAKENPQKFIVTSPTGGGSGSGFLQTIAYAKVKGDDCRAAFTNFKISKEESATWAAGDCAKPVWDYYKELLPVVEITNGNSDTLNLLATGAGAVGTAWEDMAYDFLGRGLLPPTIRQEILAEGQVGGGDGMFLPVDGKAPAAGLLLLDFMVSQEAQLEKLKVNGSRSARIDIDPSATFTPEQVARLVPTEQFASRALQNMPNNLKNAMTDYFAGNLLRGN